MIIGVPREVKNAEGRVSCTPAGVREFLRRGHAVRVETGAGAISGFSDVAYRDAGAQIVSGPDAAWAADMVYKVKEPIPSEYAYLRPDLTLFTYLHLAAQPELTARLLETRTTAVAFETIVQDGRLPLLEPMSEIAGRMSALVGAVYLGRHKGGKGMLACGIPGVLPAHVAVLGGGTAGANAARIAAGLGARVTILETNGQRMRQLEATMPPSVRTLASNSHTIAELLPTVDLLIGAVLIPGAKAPKLITRALLETMEPGSVFVDVSIDQGGCAETSRPTTHDMPVFEESGVLHYCVANMPGTYARTATMGLSNATLPYALRIADLGFEGAAADDPGLKLGLNTHRGTIMHPALLSELSPVQASRQGIA